MAGRSHQGAARRENLLLVVLGVTYIGVFAFCDALTRDAPAAQGTGPPSPAETG